MCLDADFRPNFTYVRFSLRHNLNKIVYLAFLDTNYATSDYHYWRAYANNEHPLNMDFFGTKQQLVSKTGVNLNITIVESTQLEIDVGDPINYSVNSSFVKANYLSFVNNVNIESNGLVINTIDLDCQ